MDLNIYAWNDQFKRFFNIHDDPQQFVDKQIAFLKILSIVTLDNADIHLTKQSRKNGSWPEVQTHDALFILTPSWLSQNLFVCNEVDTGQKQNNILSEFQQAKRNQNHNDNHAHIRSQQVTDDVEEICQLSCESHLDSLYSREWWPSRRKKA